MVLLQEVEWVDQSPYLVNLLSRCELQVTMYDTPCFNVLVIMFHLETSLWLSFSGTYYDESLTTIYPLPGCMVGRGKKVFLPLLAGWVQPYTTAGSGRVKCVCVCVFVWGAHLQA